jgi:hypothetical protein
MTAVAEFSKVGDVAAPAAASLEGLVTNAPGSRSWRSMRVDEIGEVQ